MGKKRKRKTVADADAKAIEKRLEHYGEGHGRDKFGKKTNQHEIQEQAGMVAKAMPLTEMKS